MAESTLEVKVQAFVDGLNSITQLGEVVAQTVESMKGFNDQAVAATDSLKKFTEATDESTDSEKKHKDSLDELGEKLKRAGEVLAEGGEKAKEFGEKLADITGIAALVSAALSLLSIEKFFETGIEGAKELQVEMRRLQAVSGETADKISEVTEEAGKIGASLGFDDAEAVRGLTTLTDKIGDVDSALQALAPAMELAKVGNINLEQSSQLLASTLAQFNLTAADSADVADVLTATAQKSKIGFDELTQQLQLVGPYAAQAGLDLRETAALMGALADSGVKGRQALQPLVEVFTSLNNPTSKFRSELLALGITAKDFGTVFTQLAQKGAAGAQAFEALSSRSQSAFKKLLADGAPALQKMTQELQNTSGAAHSAAEIIGDTFEEATKKAKDAFDDLAKALVTPALEPLTAEFLKANDAIRKFTESAQFQELAKAFAEFVSQSIEAFNEYISKIDFKELTKDVSNFFTTLKDGAKDVKDSVGGTVQTLKALAEGIGLVFNTLGTVIHAVAATVSETLRDLAIAFKGALFITGQLTTGLAQGIDDFANEMHEVARTNFDQMIASAKAAKTNLDSLAQSSQSVATNAKAAAQGTQELGTAAETAKQPISDLTQSTTQYAEDLQIVPEYASQAADGVSLLGTAADGASSSLFDVSKGMQGFGEATSNVHLQVLEILPQIDEYQRKLADLVRAGQGESAEAQELADNLRALQEQLNTFRTASAVQETEDLTNALRSLGVDSPKELQKAASAAEAYYQQVKQAFGVDTPEALKITQRAFEGYADAQLKALEFADEATKEHVIQMLREAAAAVQDQDKLEELLATLGLLAGAQENAATGAKHFGDQQYHVNESLQQQDEVLKPVTGSWNGIEVATTDATIASDGYIDSTEAQTLAIEQASAATERQRNIIANFSFELTGFGSKMADAMNELYKSASHFLIEDTGGAGLRQFIFAINSGVDRLEEKVRNLKNEGDNIASVFDTLTDKQVLGLAHTADGLDRVAASYANLAQQAAEGYGDLGLLDSADLSRLQAAASAAAARIQQVAEAARQANDSIQSLLNSTLDQIDQLLGNQQAIENRRHEEALAQIEALKAQGADPETIRKALDAENRLHNLRMQNLRNESNEAKQQSGDLYKQQATQNSDLQRQKNEANNENIEALNQQLQKTKDIEDEVKKNVIPTGPSGLAGAIGSGGGLNGLIGPGAGGGLSGPASGPSVTFTGPVTGLGTPQDLAKTIAREIKKQLGELGGLSR